MFFTIAVPIYNAQSYLDECIRSVIDQKEKDYELLLVNDGSTDNSLDICKKWSRQFPETVRYLDYPNRGSLLTRRVCLEEALGSYILIIDADDYLVTDHALSDIKASLLASKADLVFFNYTKNASTMERAVNYPYNNHEIFESDSLQTIYNQIVETRDMNSLWNKAYRKEIVDLETDYSIYADVCVGTDFFQMLPIISNAKRIEYLDKVLYYYRTTEGSIVHRFNPKFKETMHIGQRWLEMHASRWNPQIKDIDEKLATRYMVSVSSMAYKSRLLKSGKERIDFLSEIGSDSLFRERYRQANKESISKMRRIIVCLLYHNAFKILNMLLSFI